SLTAIATRPTSPRSPLAHSRPRPDGRRARGGRARRTQSKTQGRTVYPTAGRGVKSPAGDRPRPHHRTTTPPAPQENGRRQLPGGLRPGRRRGTSSGARLAQVHLEVAEVDVAVVVVVVEVLVVELGPAVVEAAAVREAVALVLALAVDAGVGVRQGVDPRLG